MQSNVSFLRRLGSITYDLLLVFSFVFFIAGIVILVNQKQPITNSLFFYLLTLPVIFSYFSISWVKGKQTLGMRAWKFEITQQDGENVTYKQSLIRLILAITSLAGIGFIFQFFNKYKLPLHDYYSKTYLSEIHK